MIGWIRLKEKVRRRVRLEEGGSGHAEEEMLCMSRSGDEGRPMRRVGVRLA